MKNQASNISEEEYLQWKLMIESALFQASQKITIDELFEGLKIIPKPEIKPLVLAITKTYEEYDSAIEIYQYDKNTFEMQVKSIVMGEPGVIKFTKGKSFRPNEVKTLAFIAYNQPIGVQDVVDFVGKSAKRSIAKLKREGFVREKKYQYDALNEEGEEVTIKMRELRTTQSFSDYLGIENNIKKIQEKLQDFIDHHS